MKFDQSATKKNFCTARHGGNRLVFHKTG